MSFSHFLNNLVSFTVCLTWENPTKLGLQGLFVLWKGLGREAVKYTYPFCVLQVSSSWWSISNTYIMSSNNIYSNVLRKPQNNFLRASYTGVQNFFSGPIAGLTNQPLVWDFWPGAPLFSSYIYKPTRTTTSWRQWVYNPGGPSFQWRGFPLPMGHFEWQVRKVSSSPVLMGVGLPSPLF